MRPTMSLTGRHVLSILLVAFAIVALVNGAFVLAAVSTFSGLAGEDGYRKGLAYNSTLADAAEQKRLGWQVALSVPSGRVVRLELTDAQGTPISGLDIAGTLGRPAASQFDQPLAFVSTGPGRYQASLGAVARGTWIAGLTVSRPGVGIVYRWKERLWLAPQG